MENTPNACVCKNCKCPHHKMVPVLVILLGLTFLLGNWEVLTPGAVNFIWPVIIILIGAMKLTSQMKMCKCC